MPPAPQPLSRPSSISESASASQTSPFQHGLLHEDDDLRAHQLLDGDLDINGRSPESSRSGSAVGKERRGAQDGKRRLSFSKSLTAKSNNDWKGKNVAGKIRGNGICYITKLPNEVLTHVLSFLDPSSLNSASFINKRFNTLMTSPHAWRIAFSRYFPQHVRAGSEQNVYPDSARYFTRLTPTSTHRSEYILRTQLLRSLKRGRPHFGLAFKTNASHSSSNFSMVTYNPKLHESTITHIAADFNRHRVIASSIYTGLYSISDPRNGYCEVEQRLHPGYSPQGLTYTLANGISAMDVSELHGQIIGDAKQQANSFFAMRTNGTKNPHAFMDGFNDVMSTVSAVWLAKKDTIVNTSGNAILSACGYTKGVVDFQGTGKAVITCVICPGIPILEIRIDDGYTKTRERFDRIWCVVVNALGEVYYLKGRMPTKAPTNKTYGHDLGLRWHCIPGTKRDKSPDGVGALNQEDSKARQKEINDLLDTPAETFEFQFGQHWGCDYFIEVDFGGQNVLVGREGTEENEEVKGTLPELRKYGRISTVDEDKIAQGYFVTAVYGKRKAQFIREEPVTIPILVEDNATPDEWTTADFKIPKITGKEKILITARAIDMSNVALLSKEEDQFNPALSTNNLPGFSSRLFAIGTSTGAIHIYNARQTASEHEFLPLRTIETESPEISTLALTSLYLVHGGTDGLVQAWDPLGSTLEPIRAIHSRFSMKARRRLAQAAASVQGIGENQYAAHALVLDPDPTQLRGVVALGTHIRSWSFASSTDAIDANSNSRRRKLTGRRGSQGNGSGTPGRFRNTSKVVIKSDIAEETKHLKGEEKKHKAEEDYILSRFGLGKGQLSEEEMLAYAQMLSAEEFEREQTSSPPEMSSLTNGFDEISILSESPTIGSTSSTSGWPDHDQDEGHWETPPRHQEPIPEDVDRDFELAKALQESFRPSDPYSPPGELSSSSNSIPIKYVKSKKLRPLPKQSMSPQSGPSDAWRRYHPTGGSSRQSNVASPRRRSSGCATGNDDLEKDIELAIQLSLEEEELRKALELSQLVDGGGGSASKGKARAA